MNIIEQRKQAREFISRWQGTGYERGQAQPFWTDLLRSVFGVEIPVI